MDRVSTGSRWADTGSGDSCIARAEAGGAGPYTYPGVAAVAEGLGPGTRDGLGKRDFASGAESRGVSGKDPTSCQDAWGERGVEWVGEGRKEALGWAGGAECRQPGIYWGPVLIISCSGRGPHVNAP